MDFELPPKLPSWAASLTNLIDTDLLLILRDGRLLCGSFRSYDQFGNILLESAKERHMVNGSYADIALGTMIIRGENIAMFGEIDAEAFEARVSRTDLKSVFNFESQLATGTSLDLGFLDEQ